MPIAPLFSVVVTAFDRLTYLKKALASVRAQTLADYELIVVDDGSRDGTWEWLKTVRGAAAVRHRRNRGVAAARNTGLSRCRGRLVAMLDSDDLWRPGFLAAMAQALSRPGTQAAFCAYEEIDGRGRRPPAALRGAAARNLQPVFLALIGRYRIPPLSSAAFRRSLLTGLGGFDERFRLFDEDTDLFLRAGALHGPAAFRYLPRRLLKRRLHAESLTGAARRLMTRPDLPALARGWEGAGPEHKDILFDILFAGHKHKPWLDLLIHGGPDTDHA